MISSSRRALPLLALMACTTAPPQVDAQGAAQRSHTPPSTAGVVRSETVVRGLEHPWGMEQLPDGRFLVTERPGRLRLVNTDGTLSAPLTGVPAVYASGQGGLLDVALDPQFATNQTIYLSFAELGSDGNAGTAVARGVLGATGLTDVRVIYSQRPKVNGGGHYGSRLVFARDGNLFVTQGDRMGYRERAQRLDQGMGKVMRIRPDGTIPPDNPFVGRGDAQPEIWSYGHRNVQAAVLHPETGELWTVEHGARGGDELNHPRKGLNYGWPVITYGVDYSGARIGEGTAKEGMEQPVYYWDPVIAPSGMAIYAGDKFPEWRGHLLIGSMTPGALVRLELENGKVKNEVRYLGELRQRIRDVKVGADGYIYLLTDSSDGQLLRVLPANR